MSKTIDERVVSLQFDNKEFEQNVKVSLTTLDKLKESLNLGEETTKGFNEIEKASKNVKLDALSNTVLRVKQEFNALNTIAEATLTNITNKAINKATSMATAGFRQIITGGIARAKNLEKADFMLRGIFKDDPSGKKAQKVMDNVSEAVSGTAYGLDEAAVIASQFAASGVKGGKEMEGALKGVAGVAAMTSSSFSDIGNIFAKVASSGRVMGDEFNQLSARGINVTATLAKELGKTEDEIVAMRKKGEISFELFSKAMTSAFGDQAKKAEETFEGAVSNMKAALSRIGAKVATPGLDNLRRGALSLRDAFNVINMLLDPLIDRINRYFKVATDVFIKFVDAFSNKFTNKLEDGSRELNDFGNNFIKAFRGILAIIDIVRYSLLILFDIITIPIRPILQALGLISNEMMEISGSSLDNLYQFRRNYWKLTKDIRSRINELNSKISEHVLKLKKWFDENTTLGKGFTKFKDKLKSVSAVLKTFFESNNSIDKIAENIEKLKEGNKSIDEIARAFRNLKINSIDTFFKTFKSEMKAGAGKLEAFKNAISAVFESIQTNALTSVLDVFKNFGEMLLDLSDKSATFVESMDFDGDGQNGVANYMQRLASSVNDAATNVKTFNEAMRDFAAFVRLNFQKNGGIGELLTVGFGVAILASLKKLNAFASSRLSPISKTLNAFNGVVTNLGLTLKATAKSLNAQNYKIIAESIAIVAGSLIALSAIDSKKLGLATGVILVIGGVLAALGWLLSTMNTRLITRAAATSVGTMGSVIKSAMALVKLSGVMVALAGAFMIISLVDTTNIWKQMAAFGVMVAGMAGLMLALGALNNKLNKGAVINMASMWGLVRSITVLSAAFVAISKVETEGLRTKIIAFLGIVVAFEVLVYALAGLENLKTIKGMTGVVAIAASISILALAFNLLARIDVGSTLSVLPKMALAIGLMRHLIKLAASAGQNAVAGGAAILAFAGSLALIGIAIKILGNVDSSEMRKAVRAISAITLVMGALIYFTKYAGPEAHKLAPTLIGVGAGMVFMAVACAVMSRIKPDGLQRAVIAIEFLMAGFAGIIAVTKLAGDADKTNKTIVLMIIAIGLLAASVGALAMIDPDRLTGAVNAMVTLMSTLSIMFMIANKLSMNIKIGSYITMYVAIGVLTAAIAVLSNYDPGNVVASAIAISTCLMALVGAMRLLKVAPITMGMVKTIAIMELVMLSLVGILAIATKIPVYEAMPAVIALSTLMGSLSIMALAIIPLSTLGPSAISGIAVMIGLMTGITAFIAIVGALNSKFPAIEKFMNEGLPILEALGSGIGRFVGGIVSGFGAAMTDGLAIAGKNFMLLSAGIVPFIDSIKKVDKTAISSVKALGEFLSGLAKMNFTSAFGKFFGGETDPVVFIEKMVSMVKGLGSLSDASANLNEEQIGQIRKISSAVKALGEAASAMPKEGGLWQALSGSKDLANVIDDIEPLITAIANISGDGGLGKISYSDIEKIPFITDAVEKFSALSDVVGNSGGLWQKISGETDLSKLGTQLSKLVESLVAISQTDGLDSINPKVISKVVEASKSMSSITEEDIKSLSKLTSMMSIYNNVDGGSTVGAAGGGKKKANALTEAMSGIGEMLTSLGDKLKPLANGGMDLIKKAFEGLKSMSGTLIELGKVKVDDFSKFASSLPELGSSLKSFADNVAGISVENIDKAKQAMTKAVNAAKTAVENSNLGESASKLSSSFASGVKDVDISGTFAKSINGAKQVINSKAGELKNAGKSLGDNFVNGYKSVDFKSSGKYTADGVIAGLGNINSRLYQKGREAGKQFKKGYDETSDINSPSREMMKSGRYTVEGLLIGLGQKAKEVYKAGASMAESANRGFNDAISVVASAAGMAITDEVVPTIRPTVDLTDINASASQIDTMFNKSQAYSIDAKMRASITEADRLNELSKNLVDGMEKAMTNALDSDDRETELNVHVHTNIDGREVAQTTAPFMNQALNKLQSRDNRQLGLIGI